MRANKIVSVLNSLLESNKRAIIIDGPWGVGKTFQVRNFIEQNKNKNIYKIVYLSLFGKKSIDEIHTQLYSYLHPTVNLISKSISILSPAINLIPNYGKNIGECLNFTLQTISELTKERSKQKVKNCKYKRYLIIFDDLERVDSGLKLSNFLGYINQLFLSQIKVAVLCNSSEIYDKNEYFNFKEKIFDREYKIEEAQSDIIDSYFDIQLDSNVADNFDNNIRLAFKTSLFFKEIRSNLLNYSSTTKCKQLKDNTLLWCCSLIVSKLNSKIDFSQYKTKMNSEFNFVRDNIDDYFSDKDIADKLECIYYIDSESTYEYSAKNDYVLSKNKSDLICSLAYIYFYDDYSLLEKLLLIEEDGLNKLSVYDRKHIFLMSEQNKRQYISEVIEDIENGDRILHEKEINVIKSLFQYCNLFPTNFDRKNFAFHFANRLLLSESKSHSINYINENSNKDFESFFELVKEELNKLRIGEINEKLGKIDPFKDVNFYYDILRELREKNFYQTNRLNNIIIKDSIEDIFYSRNLFLRNLDNDLSEEEWEIFNTTIRFMYDNANKDRLKEYLNKYYEKSSDITEKERLKFFLTKYFKSDLQ